MVPLSHSFVSSSQENQTWKAISQTLTEMGENFTHVNLISSHIAQNKNIGTQEALELSSVLMETKKKLTMIRCCVKWGVDAGKGLLNTSF
jgi:hypothetical protein